MDDTKRPTKKGLDKVLDQFGDNVSRLVSSVPALHSFSPTEHKINPIFNGVNLTQEQNNLAKHFSQAHTNYISALKTKNPHLHIDENNPNLAVHMFARFAGNARKNPETKQALISMLHGLSNKLGPDYLSHEGNNKFKISKFSHKAPSAPKTSSPEIPLPAKKVEENIEDTQSPQAPPDDSDNFIPIDEPENILEADNQDEIEAKLEKEIEERNKREALKKEKESEETEKVKKAALLNTLAPHKNKTYEDFKAALPRILTLYRIKHKITDEEWNAILTKLPEIYEGLQNT